MTIMTAAGVTYDRISGKADCHDSDTIAMPGKARLSTTLIRSQCRARPDGISSVSRADASRFIAEGIATTHARHRVATRQASARRTPGIALPHARHQHAARHATHQDSLR